MQILRKITGLAIAVTLSLLSPMSALAECQGSDLRKSLTAAEQQELNAALEPVPFPSGNHWLATREGKTVHLVGTIHLDDTRLGPIAQRLKGVVEASELLLLEMSPAEEDALKADMASRPELMFLQNETLPEVLSEEDWKALSQAMQARGIPAMLASRFQPWYLSVLLGIPPCLAQEMLSGAQNGLDHRLRDIALDAGVEMQGLEPHDTLFRLFGDASLQEQIDVMLLGLDTQDQSLDMLATVIAAYYEENHAQAWEMSRRAVMQIENKPKERLKELFDEMETDLLTARNQAWIPVILKALETRNVITVAAGAGHWSGKQGVLALLQAEGFKLKRLPF